MNLDVEKLPGRVEPFLVEDDTGAVPESALASGSSWSARLQRLSSLIKVEQRGIERVPENERTDSSYWNISSMVLLRFLPSIKPCLTCR